VAKNTEEKKWAQSSFLADNNSFVIRIDNNNDIEELDETNNTLEVNTFITSSDLVPVVPYKYGMLAHRNLVLKANSVDAFADEQTTNFQLDTTYKFNSPWLISENITHTGGLIEWRPKQSLNQGVTYFWRVAKNTEEKKWAQSSFLADNNTLGWHQSSYGQYRDNSSRFIDFNDATSTYEFTKAPKTLVCKNLGSPSNETEFRSIAYGLDGIGERSSCGAHGAMLLVVIDSLSLLPWESDYGAVGHGNYPWCGNKSKPQKYFIFYSWDKKNIENLVTFVNNEVPDGNYILIYSFINGNFDNYNEYIRSGFESWGAENIRFTRNYQPYIFFAKKGYPSTAQEIIGETTTSSIELYTELKGNFTYGSITSNVIGPAKKWDHLNWQFTKAEANNENEKAVLNVYGISKNDTELILRDSLKELSSDLSDISATEYPYLKLEFYTEDKEYRTPSLLNYWEVIYEPVTDLGINPQKGFEFLADTLHEGEDGSLSIAFENIGMVDQDSTSVSYWIQNSSNETFPVKNKKIKPLKAGEMVIDTVSFNTLSKRGNHSFWIELNPANSPQKAPRNLEQYYFNNLAQKPFYMVADKSNPMLDVTFDGVHIMDGDLISARPEVVIQLKDENKFIALRDTSVFSVYLKSQNTGIERKISISNNDEMHFIPAQLPRNKAQLIYNPAFTEDGIYELRVQAIDPSGNESGAFDYIISFQVITESTITNVFNYPNPFSTATKFVFELTGSEIPDAMRIEILTVTGKVVKVIYLEDLGVLRIGKNITDYTWDGTDMYGDLLANGVYFYRVNARMGSKELKVRDTGTNKFFKNGFGKMYIMR